MKSFKENNKYGFMDDDNNVVVPPVYDAVPYTIGHRNIVRKGEVCGVVSEKGDNIIDFKYDGIQLLLDGLYAVRKNDSQANWECFVIDESENIIIKNGFKSIYRVGQYIQCFKSASYEFSTYSSSANRYTYKWQKDGSVYDKLGNFVREGKLIDDLDDIILFEQESAIIPYDVREQKVLSEKFEEFHLLTRNRYIVRKSLEDGDWAFGVIDKLEKVIVPFKFKYIKEYGNCFIQCFISATCEKEWKQDLNHRYSYEDLSGEVWFNSDGLMINKGKANYLGKSILAVMSESGKWGVKDNNNIRIVDYIYDKIDYISSNIVIAKDGNIGLLGQNGELILSPSYKKIECVNIQNGKYIEGWNNEVFGCYCHEYTYDTEGCAFTYKGEKWDRLFHKEVSIDKRGFIRKSGEEYFTTEKILILSTNEYSELFSIEKGVIPNSRFEEINQLTDLSYCVKQNGLYGIYRVDEERLIIPCAYSRVIFEGLHLVFLCKDNRWGAKSLVLKSHFMHLLFNADFSPKFIEIKLLNNSERLFSVKTEEKKSDGKIECFYSIADSQGNLLERISALGHFDKHFEWYNSNKILTQLGSKYGFISLSGFFSIPFKYDEIELRKDGCFNVRIDKSWGVMTIDGYEFIPVKYSEKIADNFKDLIVQDSISGGLGILNEHGKECIPTLYEHLQLTDNQNIIFFGYGGCESDCNNFFSPISYASWGCLSNNGKILITPHYDCFKFYYNLFILAGRDGHMLGEGQHGCSYHETEYSGLYDLYNFDGKLILGGFTDFSYDNDRKLYLFRFGGQWKTDCEDYDEYGNSIFYYSFHFEKGNSRWLILDNNLTSIVKDKQGRRKVFNEGFIGTITRKEEKGRVVNYWNMPLELFSINRPCFSHNLMICDNDNYQVAIRLEDGSISSKHNKIHVISNDLFFFMDVYEIGRGVGLSKFAINKEGELTEKIMIDPIDEGNCILTTPIEGYVFGIYEYDNNLCGVRLYDINDAEKKPLTAIESIEESKLIDYISRGFLLISIDNSASGLSRMIMPQRSIFDKSFVDIISPKESELFYKPFEKEYWFTDDCHLYDNTDNEDCLDGDFGDSYDFMKDSWDAMTDGMYGDMPDGFDGDFDFLGR